MRKHSASNSHIIILQTAGWPEVMASRTGPFIDPLINWLGEVGSLLHSSVRIHEQLPPIVEGYLLPGILFSLGGHERNLRGRKHLSERLEGVV